MSLSRQIALLANDETKYREAMNAIAKNLIASGKGTMRTFLKRYRAVSHGLHAGGFEREQLKKLHVIAKEEFRKALRA
jgi:hypothetical protein